MSNVIADRIDRALRGDRDALEDLVRFEGPRLFGIAWRITGDTALAEDVVQEVFLRILGGRVQYHRSGSGEAWLSRVTAHAAIDLVRRRTARERREEAYAMGGADRAGEARDAVADAEVRALVAEGFGTLPIDVRAAIWLTVVEGDSLRQVSHAIGLPVTTIHRRVHDGLETLKKFIARRGATAVLAVPMADVLRRMPAPPAPGGLAAGVLARIAASSAAGGAVEAGAAAGRLIRKGDLFMAALNAKKAGTGVVIALLLLLGAAAFVADPFHLRGGREVEIAKAPAAAPAPPAAVNAPPTAPAGEPEESGKPEEASPVDPFGSLLAHAVHEDDLTPVPGVLARAFRKGSPELLTVTTDENGEARFPQVPEGSFQVYLQRGSTTYAGKKVEVKAGRESEVTLELPPGVGIDGIVVDGEGRPVSGASIWLTEVHNAFQGAAVAVAGEDGKFEMRHVELKRLIGARAPGSAPSLLRTIEGRPAGVLSIRIVLDQPAVVVEGVVVGPEGNPLPGAKVKIGRKAGGLMWTPDGIEIRYAPLSARTDSQGAFAFDCVPEGDLTIAARSDGLVPFEEQIAVPGEGLSGVRIELEEGATVTGTVRTPEGNAATGTLVAIGPGESTEPYRSGDLASVAATVGQDGAFRLTGVKPGGFEVRADSRGKGKASARFAAEAGEEVRWDAQLTLGLEIFGRVVDGNGKPFEKVLVGADGKGCNHTWIWTDREGRFRFSNCNAVPHLVSTRLGDSEARAAQEEVMPGSGELTLVIRPGVRPSAFITGKVVDPAGRPAEAARIGMLGLSTIYPEKDGSFRIGPLPPGRHQFDVLLGEHPRVRRGCELAANQTADLGTIQVHRGGRVEARLLKPDGTPRPCAIWILNAAGDLDVESKCSPDGIVSSQLAQPGDYSILVWHRGLAATWVPVRIEDGQTASAEVTIHEGLERVFQLSSPEKPGDPTRVIVRAADGTRVFDRPIWPDAWKPSPDSSAFLLKLYVSFTPGTGYTAEAFLRDRSASASFPVSDAAETADPIVLDLR